MTIKWSLNPCGALSESRFNDRTQATEAATDNKELNVLVGVHSDSKNLPEC